MSFFQVNNNLFIFVIYSVFFVVKERYVFKKLLQRVWRNACDKKLQYIYCIDMMSCAAHVEADEASVPPSFLFPCVSEFTGGIRCVGLWQQLLCFAAFGLAVNQVILLSS